MLKLHNVFFFLFYVLFGIVKCQWIEQRSESWKVTTEKLRVWKTFYSLDHRKSKGIIKKKKKNLLCFIDYAKAFDCVDHNKLEYS